MSSSLHAAAVLSHRSHKAMSGANAPPSHNVDEGGEIVLNRFYDFLAKFTSSAEGTTDGTDGVQLYRDYLAQIAAMVQNDKNTVYVDVQHVFAVRVDGVLSMVNMIYSCGLLCWGGWPPEIMKLRLYCCKKIALPTAAVLCIIYFVLCFVVST